MALQHRRDPGTGTVPEAFRMDGVVAVYFEATAVITALVPLGRVLELRARAQTSGAIKALLGLSSKTARRVGGADGTLLAGAEH